MRDIIEGGPPECILTRFNSMFKDLELATHLLFAKVMMREMGWHKLTRSSMNFTRTCDLALPQSMSFLQPFGPHGYAAPVHCYRVRTVSAMVCSATCYACQDL